LQRNSCKDIDESQTSHCGTFHGEDFQGNNGTRRNNAIDRKPVAH
jgi:hypothetical protein